MAVTKNIIPVSVDSRFIDVGDHVKVMAGNVGVDFVALTFDAEWDGLTKVVTFSGCAPEPTPLDYAAELEIPWEQIEEPCELYIGVQGFDPSAEPAVDTGTGTVAEATVPVLNAATMTIPITVFESGESGGTAPTQPTGTVLQRVQQDLLALEKLSGDAPAVIEKVNSAAQEASAAASKADSSAASADAAAKKATDAASKVASDYESDKAAWQSQVDAAAKKATDAADEVTTAYATDSAAWEADVSAAVARADAAASKLGGFYMARGADGMIHLFERGE